MRFHFISTAILLLLFAFAPVPHVRGEKIVLVAGGSEERVDIDATRAKLHEPFAVDFDRHGNLYILEMESGNRLLQIDTRGVIHQIAGQFTPGDAGDGGPAMTAQFRGPHTLVVLPNDHVLIGDTWNGRIRAFDPGTRCVTTLPGYGVPASQARDNGPYCIAIDFSGARLYIADLLHISVLDLPSGQLSIVAGNGQKGLPIDGAPVLESPLVDPRAVAVDRKGNIYILERNGHALRVVMPNGLIRTVVNASGKRGASGDGGDAALATMNGPKHLCIDLDDSVLIADAENNIIRRYIPSTGKIVRVAGTGIQGAAGLDGPPERCELARPHGVTVARDGTLYITDSYNERILKIIR